MSLDALAQKPHDRLRVALEDDLARVNGLIQDRMASEHAPRIPEITAHLVDAGGKRIRPILTLAAARICGYSGAYHVHLAATVEFIHTATLLHDDVVDKSTQRRGKPAANFLWDNKSSVLVGDYLFARSFQLMTDTGRLDVLRVLSDAAATIAEGEVLQLSTAQNLATTEEIYLRVIRGKTAALFSAATQVGGMIADADPEVVSALFSYGDALGVSFQIVDDVLDFAGDAQKTGKNVGDDFRERKLTLPMIKAIAAGGEADHGFWQRTIEKGEQRDGDLQTALDLLTRYQSIDEARADALAWASRAKEALGVLPSHPIVWMLSDLADYVVARVR